MGTIAAKLQTLANTKAALRLALQEQGQSVDAATPFSAYPDKIRAIAASGEESLDPLAVYQRTRPADWLPIPPPGENEMYLLFHILDGTSELLAFQVYTQGGVSWTLSLGTVTNGAFVPQSTQTLASGTTFETELFAADWGNLTTGGVKQVMLKISGPVVSFAQAAHSAKTYPAGYANWSIVELQHNFAGAHQVMSPSPGAQYNALGKLRYYAWRGAGSPTQGQGLFAYCRSLVCVLSLGSATFDSAAQMFQECRSLRAIPPLHLSKEGVISSDQGIPTDSMFSGCRSLTAIPAITVREGDYLSNLSEMFRECSVLKALPALDTSQATDASYLCYACHGLRQIPELDLSCATTIAYAFALCSGLACLGKLRLAAATSASNTFNACTSLRSLRLDPTASGWAGCSLTLQYCTLSHSALVALLESLPTVSSARTLNLSGSPAGSTLTAAEKAIAANKNWTLSL